MRAMPCWRIHECVTGVVWLRIEPGRGLSGVNEHPYLFKLGPTDEHGKAVVLMAETGQRTEGTEWFPMSPRMTRLRDSDKSAVYWTPDMGPLSLLIGQYYLRILRNHYQREMTRK